MIILDEFKKRAIETTMNINITNESIRKVFGYKFYILEYECNNKHLYTEKGKPRKEKWHFEEIKKEIEKDIKYYEQWFETVYTEIELEYIYQVLEKKFIIQLGSSEYLLQLTKIGKDDFKKKVFGYIEEYVKRQKTTVKIERIYEKIIEKATMQSFID